MIFDRIEFDQMIFNVEEFPNPKHDYEKYEVKLYSILESNAPKAITLLREHRLITQLWFRYCFKEGIPFCYAANVAASGISEIAKEIIVEVEEIDHLGDLQLDLHDDELFAYFSRVITALSCLAGLVVAADKITISTGCLLPLTKLSMIKPRLLPDWVEYNLTAPEYDHMFNLLYGKIKSLSDCNTSLFEIADMQCIKELEKLIGYEKPPEYKLSGTRLLSREDR
jgi:hypothetical protein